MANKLTLITGGERERAFVERGDSIVDFLTDPFRPCLVYGANRTDIIALNKGKKGGFSSFFLETQVSATAKGYSVEYLADEAVVLEMPRAHIAVPRDPSKYLQQNCACEMAYQGNSRDILHEFLKSGFTVEKGHASRFTELEAQKQRRVAELADKIREFYGTQA